MSDTRLHRKAERPLCPSTGHNRPEDGEGSVFDKSNKDNDCECDEADSVTAVDDVEDNRIVEDGEYILEDEEYILEDVGVDADVANG